MCFVARHSVCEKVCVWECVCVCICHVLFKEENFSPLLYILLTRPEMTQLYLFRKHFTKVYWHTVLVELLIFIGTMTRGIIIKTSLPYLARLFLVVYNGDPHLLCVLFSGYQHRFLTFIWLSEEFFFAVHVVISTGFWLLYGYLRSFFCCSCGYQCISLTFIWLSE